jgi:hypothetical protein
MNDSLKVIERMIDFLYSELINSANNININDDETHNLLKEAAVDCINLKEKINTARRSLNTK